MQSIIKILADALPCRLYANIADKRAECAVYDLAVEDYDGIKRRCRLKLTVLAKTMARGLELEGMADAALCTVGDQPLTDTVRTCFRNGGGWRRDGDWHIRTAYYSFIAVNN